MFKYWKNISRWKKILIIFIVFIALAEVWFRYRVRYSESKFPSNYKNYVVENHPDGKVCEDSWLKKNPEGLFELYIQGNPINRGLKMGSLLKELLEKQEDVFVAEFDHFIPNWFLQNGIQRMVAWFNKDMESQIPIEFLEEVYAESRFAPSKHERVGPAYQRMVNYHGAHDIGHALQNLNLVGCTSFGLWGKYTENQDIIIGRNFDFYVNEAFAENKIVCMEKPDSGYGMVYVTWAGFIGVVSGMNQKGLSLTLNAAPSEIPYSSATPVSFIGREVLQYAKNIQEAFEIIKKRQVFVSETFMIGSLEDNQVVVIEKTPEKTEMFVQQDKILCTNHFQSEKLKNSELNKKQLKDNPSLYRMNRLEELLSEKKKYEIKDVVKILRDTKGIHGENLGYCNEGAVNQLIAHHSVMFSLKDKKMWVSANPYACGTYVQYNLDSIFNTNPLKISSSLRDSSQNISADPFLQTIDYQHVKFFRSVLSDIRNTLGKTNLAEKENQMIQSNPEYFGTYLCLAEYWFDQKNYKKAEYYINLGLKKIIPSGYDKQKFFKLQKKIDQLK